VVAGPSRSPRDSAPGCRAVGAADSQARGSVSIVSPIPPRCSRGRWWRPRARCSRRQSGVVQAVGSNDVAARPGALLPSRTTPFRAAVIRTPHGDGVAGCRPEWGETFDGLSGGEARGRPTRTRPRRSITRSWWPRSGDRTCHCTPSPRRVGIRSGRGGRRSLTPRFPRRQWWTAPPRPQGAVGRRRFGAAVRRESGAGQSGKTVRPWPCRQAGRRPRRTLDELVG